MRGLLEVQGLCLRRPSATALKPANEVIRFANMMPTPSRMPGAMVEFGQMPVGTLWGATCELPGVGPRQRTRIAGAAMAQGPNRSPR
jgi:hypothetical protein